MGFALEGIIAGRGEAELKRTRIEWGSALGQKKDFFLDLRNVIFQDAGASGC
jgi:hypothetical protein